MGGVFHWANIFCDRDAEQPPEGAQMLLNPKEDPDKLKTTSPHTTFKSYIIFFDPFQNIYVCYCRYTSATIGVFHPQTSRSLLCPSLLGDLFHVQSLLGEGGRMWMNVSACISFTFAA